MSDTLVPNDYEKYQNKCVEQARQAMQLADGAVMVGQWLEARRHADNALAWIKSAQHEAKTEKE
jgi:hypothetical protein